MYPSEIENLIRLFSRFPTIGPRTATRFAFYLLQLSKTERDKLIEGIASLNNVKTCKYCYRSGEESCSICEDKGRDKDTLCVVERETDFASIEKTKIYKGLYFILGGSVSPLRKEDFKNVRGRELKKRVIEDKIKEVIIATNQNTEGEATALYVERVLKETNTKVSRLGRGLPTGGELEYADEETLKSALQKRD